MNGLHYLDTSFIAAYLIPEPDSDRVEATLHSLPDGSFRVSQWTRTELASLLARKVRMKELSEQDSLRVFGIFDELVNSGVFVMVSIAAEEFQKASGWVLNASLGLRGPDGLHLAVTHKLDATIWTLDVKLKTIAEKLGLRTGSLLPS